MALKFWSDREKMIIDKNLFSEKAEELAKNIKRDGNKTINSPTQLRKFYDEVVRFQGMVESSPEQFDAILPYIRMLNAKAAYAAGRKLISESFKNFLSESLAQIENQKDFEVFCSLFEAFLGFYKYYYEKHDAQGGSGDTKNSRNQPGGGHYRR